MKQFFKALPKEGECFRYLCKQFPVLSEAKLKEGLDIRKLMRDANSETKSETKVKAA